MDGWAWYIFETQRKLKKQCKKRGIICEKRDFGYDKELPKLDFIAAVSDV